ncbi:hypothetical protein POM88_021940 [Heracleum sosnowskyi]|uniref:Ubiquitin-like protease family profile domain-containing protein n=1 Tax=Heracleum sosnowskyi TaxID=360622 RepID=A0AAD8IHW2_9APIA|nr:hypothetical protein POM88_021940 [Heracleum sosnowskyi]
MVERPNNGSQERQGSSARNNKGRVCVGHGCRLPPVLKHLWLWAKNALTDGQVSTFLLSQEAFGSTNKKTIFLSDVHALCSGDEISGSIICMFINVLQEYLKKHKMSNMVAFVEPAIIGAIGCGTVGDRSRALSIRFKNAQPGQIFLLPYNSVNHWTLTAVNPDSQMVYHMDPLKRRIAAAEEWIEVVDNAIKLYKDKEKKFLKKKIMWENLAWLRRSNHAYGITELNAIRIKWAKYFMKKHAT